MFRDQDPDDDLDEEDSDDDEGNSNIEINLNFSNLVVGDFALVNYDEVQKKYKYESITITCMQFRGQNWK